MKRIITTTVVALTLPLGGAAVAYTPTPEQCAAAGAGFYGGVTSPGTVTFCPCPNWWDLISTSVLARAIAIREDAREHKRLSQHHRRRAQKRMEELQRFCDYYGIELQTIKAKTEERHGPAEWQH